eukprot:3672639-Pyramimonas_sp.AAC.1
MDHWLAMDDLSRGLHDETARVTSRDRATDSMAAQGVHDEPAIHACNFLMNLTASGKNLEYC